MAKAFTIDNQSLVVTDTVTNEILLDRPKRDMYYNVSELNNNDQIVIYDVSGTYIKQAFVLRCDLSDAVDSEGTTFTKATFIAFARENLGFSASGQNGGGMTDTGFKQIAANFSALTSGTTAGDLAYVNASQGTKWLPGTLGGNFYPAGVYRWTGTAWVSDRNAIANDLNGAFNTATWSGSQITLGTIGNASDVSATMPNATSSANGAMPSTDKAKIDKLDETALNTGMVLNVENEQTVGSGGDISSGDLLVLAGVVVNTVDGLDYIGVVRDKGANATHLLPEGIAVKDIALNGREQNAMLVQGVTTITQTGLGTRANGDKLYIELTGTGSTQKWQFTVTDSDNTYHVGRVMNYASGNDYVVYLDFTLVKASEHLRPEATRVQEPVISIVSTLPASPSEGDRHIFTGTGTNQNKIATRVGTNWEYSDTPTKEWLVNVTSEDRYYKFTTEWKKLISGEPMDIVVNLSSAFGVSRSMGNGTYREMAQFVIDNQHFEVINASFMSTSFASGTLFAQYQSVGGATTYKTDTINTSSANGIYVGGNWSALGSSDKINVQAIFAGGLSGPANHQLYSITIHTRYR